MNQASSFAGVFIPREVFLDPHLTPNCKIIYGIIQALDGRDGCFCHNSYLAGLMSLSEETVRASLYILEKKGYIDRKNSKDGVRVIRTTSTKHLKKISEANWVSDGKSTEGTENSGGGTENSGETPPENSGVSHPITIDKNNTDVLDKDNKDPFVDYSKEFHEAWREFKKFRNKMKRPLTPYAEKLIVKKFKGIEEKLLIKALQLSIERSWIGVFPDAVQYAGQKTNSKTALTDADHESF